MANRYQYTVVKLHEGMIGGQMSGDSSSSLAVMLTAFCQSAKTPATAPRLR